MTDTRPCTCHPDDSPPVPCAKKYALLDCFKARIAHLEALIAEAPHGRGCASQRGILTKRGILTISGCDCWKKRP